MPSFSSPRARSVLLALPIAMFGGRLWAQPPAQSTAGPAAGATGAAQADVEFFEKKVRPLLVARCHECHGPDKQKASLRLDSRAAVLKGGDTGPAIVPGQPDESLLVDAIRYGETYQMPPKSQLPAEEIATLVEWVRMGAPWGRETAATLAPPASAFDLQARAKHWSFRPLAVVEPPPVRQGDWVRTPVDRFILAGLEAAGLTPAPAADKAALLRRVTYDLIGLPPTPAEIQAFAADDSASAYEKVVDRLLASPRYGERWARHWLDLIRYAETLGHEFDFDLPNAYRYRDYVIRAFDADLPYDRLVVEHVAGDLLPAPRRHPSEGFNESIIATGWFFLGEAKHSPVDVRQDEADRIDNQIDVLAKTFLGLTVSCARCHDHKFDPIGTKDYYALAGYLQSSRYQQAFIDPAEVLERALAELEQLNESRRRIWKAAARETLAASAGKLAAALLADRRDIANDEDVFLPWHGLVRGSSDATAGDFREHRARMISAMRKWRAEVDTKGSLLIADFGAGDFHGWQPTGAAFGHRPASPFDWQVGGESHGRLLGASAAHSGLISDKLRGVLRSPTFEILKPTLCYRLYGNGGKVRLIVDGLQLIRAPIYGNLEFAPAAELPYWHLQNVSKWIGHRAYVELVDDGDGYLALEQLALSDGRPPDAKPNSLVVAALDDRRIVSLTDAARKLQELCGQVAADWPADVRAAGAGAEERAQLLGAALDRCRRADEGSSRPDETLAALDERQRAAEARIGPPRQAMAMADGTAENEHVFVRGSHKTLGEEVPRRFLEVLGGTGHAPPQQGSGRLELAEQMVSPANPLLPRVMVNRLWHHHFGAGIVRSPDDFGAMGQPPTHPELLDWLAAEFVREGWSIKRMHRLLVLSNTYRMASQTRPEADRVDPQNKLWHRMAVRRLEAECIRDALLAVSGRADMTQFGPSVMPHLTSYMVGRGRPGASGPLDGDGRRSIYLAVRRNFLPPLFLAFDYPTPFTTIGRRGTSNVPAQALAMMNNPLVIEQARLWATRVLAAPDRSPAERVRVMYLAALGREPDDSERRAALEFLGAAQDGSRPEDVASWADLAHVLFESKEFIFIP